MSKLTSVGFYFVWVCSRVGGADSYPTEQLRERPPNRAAGPISPGQQAMAGVLVVAV